ncbi:MAG TPA: AAA family ATPase [Solirubrobacteraceae bacterium]|jgi:hypothetical protein
MAGTAGVPSHTFEITHEIGIESHLDARLAALIIEQGVSHVATATWRTGLASLGALFEAATGSARSAHGQSVLVDVGERFGATAHALVSLRHGTANATIATSEPNTIDAIERWLREAVPGLDLADAHELPVRFWTCAQYGPSCFVRTVRVPVLSEIRENYPAPVSDQLERLAGAALTHNNGGQLILWHGASGTGKTYALRALGWEWRHWCDVEYVIDPDVFFGSRADYMVEVLLDGGDRSVELGSGRSIERGATDESERWRLLVLEDTGELLSADAKERTGQGLSRLLNLVDGIVGQGMRLLVLVTTNEPLRRLHPAVSRPGRCAARVEFLPFSATDASTWLADRGGSASIHSRTTLAELFAQIRGQEPEPAATVGFAP